MHVPLPIIVVKIGRVDLHQAGVPSVQELG